MLPQLLFGHAGHKTKQEQKFQIIVINGGDLARRVMNAAMRYEVVVYICNAKHYRDTIANKHVCFAIARELRVNTVVHDRRLESTTTARNKYPADWQQTKPLPTQRKAIRPQRIATQQHTCG